MIEINLFQKKVSFEFFQVLSFEVPHTRRDRQGHSPWILCQPRSATLVTLRAQSWRGARPRRKRDVHGPPNPEVPKG